MAHYADNTFQGGTLHLDGNEYRNCRMERCTLQYGGTAPMVLVGCTMVDCGFELVGPAADTVGFLRALYHDLGGPGRHFAEEIIASIRRRPGRDRQPKLQA